MRRLAHSLDVDVLLMHLGSVQFPITGPLRYSMNSGDAVKLVTATQPRVAVPVHYEGWSHFHEPEPHLRSELMSNMPGGCHLRWLPLGEPQEV